MGWVALVVALVAAGWLTVVASRDAAVRDARTAALAQANDRLPKLLSYRHATLDRDLGTAESMTTGSFHTDYARVLDTVVRPTATAKKVDTVAAVTSAGVVSASRDRVVVLAFVTQTTRTTSSRGAAPSVTGSRVEVTLVPVGDTWLISDLEPV